MTLRLTGPPGRAKGQVESQLAVRAF